MNISRRPHHVLRIVATAIALVLAGCTGHADPSSSGSSKTAAQAQSATGLAPQFSTWPVPIYTANVTTSTTYAPVSYGIETSDAPDTVLDWYKAKLSGRTTSIAGRVRQLAVDGGTYVINVLPGGHGGTSINVIKNG